MNPHYPTTPSMPADDTTGFGGSQESTTTGNTTDTLAEKKAGVKQSARNTANKLKTNASSTISRAKEEAERVVREKKEEAAGRIGGYSSAIHDSARAFEDQDPNIAWFTHRAADRLQEVADYMRDRDFADLRTDAENVARRHPAVFFGGMFALGLVVGNLVKASRPDEMDYDDDYRSNRSDDWMNRQEDDFSSQPELPMSSSPMTPPMSSPSTSPTTPPAPGI